MPTPPQAPDPRSEASQPDPQTRRELLKVCVWLFPSGMALALGIPGARYLLAPLEERGEARWIEIADLKDLQAGDTPLEVRFRYMATSGYTRRMRPALVLVVPNAPGEDPLVLSPICTHKGCNVAWSAEESLLACPCHGGRYDATGAVVSGPPPNPLTRVPSEVREGRLWVELTPGVV